MNSDPGPIFLETRQWQSSPLQLTELLQLISGAKHVGQRPGDFYLGPALPGGVEAWPSGRCFNQELEIRWWPDDDSDLRSVLLLGSPPATWKAPALRPPEFYPVAELEEVSYLCLGKFDARASIAQATWWESRYARAFHYGEPARPAQDQGDEGRVYLHATIYYLSAGGIQHQLRGFSATAIPGHPTIDSIGRCKP